MAYTDATYVLFYVIAAISFACSCYVTGCIFRFGSDAPSTKLVLYIHTTLLIEDISSLPYIFNTNPVLCKVFGWIHIYSGLANAVVVGMMMVTYRYLFIEDTWHICAFLVKYCEWLIFVFPLITVFPFTTDSFGEESANTWCGLGNYNNTARIWIVAVYYGWVVTILVGSSLSLIHTIWHVYKADAEMALKLFNSIGLYAAITILSWIPRGISKISAVSTFESVWGYYFIYFSGLFYFLVFLTEKRSMELLEIRNLSDRKSGAPKESFDWDVESENGGESSTGSRFTLNDRTASRVNSHNSENSQVSSTASTDLVYANRIASVSIDHAPNRIVSASVDHPVRNPIGAVAKTNSVDRAL